MTAGGKWAMPGGAGTTSCRISGSPKTITPASDRGSGLAPGGGVVKRADGTWVTTGLAKPYCTPGEDPTTIVGLVPDSPPYVVTDSAVEGDRCYVYYYEAEDQAGNIGVFAPTSIYVPGAPG